MKLRILARVLTPIAAIGLVLATAGAAEATIKYPVKTVTNGFCIAKLQIDTDHSGGHDYAKGLFSVDSGIFGDRHCYGWLETNEGSGYKRVSYVYKTDAADKSDATGWHYDGSGYRSRVCVYYTYPVIRVNDPGVSETVCSGSY
ncbi:hypothetical protein [Amycolatopsis sp.]|uniref:hypothetical protein n=1 Tax=Amycolatopsis sp. TaxID=37632 RepID=UPI002C0B1B12|nr:hypothetical protein [Amycolatopsis sp.]HVV13171.1 hypothetical protein [Amycolatopsis sp.]